MSRCGGIGVSSSALRACAILSIAVLVALSWLPSYDMVRTGILPHWAEHLTAYMISGLLVAATMPRFRFVHVACFYALLASVLELGQTFVPGRDAEVLTAIISMSGAVIGEIMARIITGVWQEKYGFPVQVLGSQSAMEAPLIPKRLQ